MKAVSPVRYFDAAMLELARWMAERYVAPLATVLGAMSPPRVAGEEGQRTPTVARGPGGRFAPSLGFASVRAPRTRSTRRRPSFAVVRVRSRIRPCGALRGGRGGSWCGRRRRTSSGRRSRRCAACLAGGRRAIVLVPEASPMPATTAALRGGVRGAGLRVRGRGCAGPVSDVAGDPRRRVRRGRGDAARGVRARPDVGLALGLARITPRRIERSARPTTTSATSRSRRAQLAAGVCVLAAACPIERGRGGRVPRGDARRAAVAEGRGGPPRHRGACAAVGARPPGGDARVRLRAGSRLRRGAGLPGVRRPGGVRGVRRHACGLRPARCGASSARRPGAAARAARRPSGSDAGGAERVEEWVGRVAAVPVARVARPRLPRATGEIVVGGPEVVRDLGVGGLDLVAVLDADLAAARPGACRARARAGDLDGGGGLGAPGRSGDRAELAPVGSRGAGARARQPRPVPSRASAHAVRRPGSRSARRCSGSSGPPSSNRRSQEQEPITTLADLARGPDGMLARARARPAPRVRGRDAIASPPRASSSASKPNRTSDEDPHAATDPHPGGPGAPRAGKARRVVRPCAAPARQGHDRDDVRGPRRRARRPRRSGSRCSCSCSTTASTVPVRWRTRSCSTPTGRSPRRRAACRSRGRTIRRRRAQRIRCRGLGRPTGKPLDIVGDGLLARIFQHETDHLRGHALHRSAR